MLSAASGFSGVAGSYGDGRQCKSFLERSHWWMDWDLNDSRFPIGRKYGHCDIIPLWVSSLSPEQGLDPLVIWLAPFILHILDPVSLSLEALPGLSDYSDFPS